MFINLLVLFLLFLTTVFKLISLREYSNFGKYFIYFFTLEHFCITSFFAFYLDKFPTINDPQRFYEIANNANSWFYLFGFGNSFMSFLAYPLVKLGITIESCFFIFSFFGWLGFMKIFELLHFKSLTRIHLYHLFFILPSINLWTSSLSKEPLLLFLIASVLSFCSETGKKNYKFFVFSLFLILLIRPHVFIILFSSYITLFHLKIKKIETKWLFLLAIFGIVIFFTLTKYFLKVEFSSLGLLVENLTLTFESQSLKGNTGISVVNTNLFKRILYLLFMPLPLLYKSESVFQLLASIENFYYVVVFAYLILKLLKSRRDRIASDFDVIYALVNVFLMTFFFASYLYNMGLGSRMRIMVYPFLFYFLIKNLNHNKSSLNKINSYK